MAYVLIVLGALILVGLLAPKSTAERLEAAPSCFISHLIWRKVQPLESGGEAMHFLGFLEDGEVRITDFERSVPVWPAMEPNVLMCVQFSPSDSRDSPIESF